MRLIHGVPVNGVLVDDQTRCEHYNSALDIIAIRFKCCDRWFPCRECHDESESHEVEVWPKAEFTSKAILCGSCGEQLNIKDYLDCDDRCPTCTSRFNPGCANHYHLYFNVEEQR